MTDKSSNLDPAIAAEGKTAKRAKKAKSSNAAPIGSAMSYPPDLRLVKPDEFISKGREAETPQTPRKPRASERPDNAPRKPATRSEKRSAEPTKTQAALSALRRKRGASIAELQQLTGWQAHSVRGFLSGMVKKKLGLKLTSDVGKDSERRYRVENEAAS